MRKCYLQSYKGKGGRESKEFSRAAIKYRIKCEGYGTRDEQRKLHQIETSQKQDGRAEGE